MRTRALHNLCQLFLASFAVSSVANAAENGGNDLQLPLIIWHGLGDKYDADGLNSVAELAKEVNPDTFVYNIRLDEDPSLDQRATFFGNLTEQLATVCADLAKHPILSTAPAVNALGFSQGGQFLRAYIEKCNTPPVWNLVTFGSQHNGINQFQECAPTDWLCRGAQALLQGTTWSAFVQGNLVPAQYFRDAEDLGTYLENSNFLADINNEREVKNEEYKDRIEGLKKFVMFVFEEDTTVHPKESGWFAEVNKTTGDVTPLQKRPIYTEDWLGLKKLDEKDGLVFKTTPGRHMQLDDKILRETFADYYGPVVDPTDCEILMESKLLREEMSLGLQQKWLEL